MTALSAHAAVIPSVDAEILALGRAVLQTEARALDVLTDTLGDSFITACRTIAATGRQVVITGMGKSGHIARKAAATFAATGTPSIYVHPGEAAHGDLGMLAKGDTLIVLSNSGNTAELRSIIEYAKATSISIIGLASSVNSMVIEFADVRILLPKEREACPANVAPTTSTTMQLALCDALAITTMRLRGITSQQLRQLHPGGTIGYALSAVRDIMHGLDRLPLVSSDARMDKTISIMTSGCLGLAGVVDDAGVLIGVITDGDLRRHFAMLGAACAADVMTRSPKLLSGDTFAADALQFLSDNKITAAFVVDREATPAGVPIGIVHIHDLLRLGLD